MKAGFGGLAMKKLYNILKIVLLCFIGVFIGSSIYQYHDYKTHPDIYVSQSAPWYVSIEIRGILTAIIVMAILITMLIIKKKIK